jgi:hypothetical protein
MQFAVTVMLICSPLAEGRCWRRRLLGFQDVRSFKWRG